jgi:signal transduction histidine kinase
LADGIDSMSAALEEYEQTASARLLRETSKSEAVVHNIADGVIVTGLDDEVLVVNAPVERWFSNDDEATDPNGEREIDISNISELIRETAEDSGNTVHSREITIELPGQIRSTILHARATRVENDGGEFAGVTTVLRDVTAEREIDRMKTELVSVVAHELRSPLVSIMGFSGILLEENLDLSTRLEFARIINDESNRMVEMINKFLDISRIESGKTQVVKVPTDVVELVQQVIDINRGQADSRNIRVETAGPARSTPVTIDPELIGQAVLNLFSNAVKYSPEERVIRVSILEHRNNIEISVADEGYGISEEAQQRLFEKFYRVDDDPNVRDIKGTGLGLSLVKEIIEQHGGKVSAESTPGEGSTFRVFLPKEWS